jgi:hypothetical protein
MTDGGMHESEVGETTVVEIVLAVIGMNSGWHMGETTMNGYDIKGGGGGK